MGSTLEGHYSPATGCHSVSFKVTKSRGCFWASPGGKGPWGSVMTYSGIGEMPLGTHECAGNNRRARARVVAVVKPRKLQATKRL